MKVPYYNETDKFLHFGAVTIPPGETRDVDECLLPDYQAPENAAQDDAADPLLAISAMSIAKIEAGIADLSLEEIDRLEALEKEKASPRQGLMAVILSERLRRAELAASNAGSEGDSTGGQGGDQ